MTHHCGILDDLDVRASDLLQSNGIVWVEGPSDRVYMNRLIQLWTDGQLQEGTHYQCVFYGGRLLAHLSSEAPDEAETDQAVSILRVNRNAAIVIDSDRRSAGAPINATKRRIEAEIEQIGGLAWVTAGREIENYIPLAAVAAWRGMNMPPPQANDPYASFFDYLETLKAGLGDTQASRKPAFAEVICPFLARADLEQMLDLDSRMVDLCARIASWNSQ